MTNTPALHPIRARVILQSFRLKDPTLRDARGLRRSFFGENEGIGYNWF